jgi:hypothetical protein
MQGLLKCCKEHKWKHLLHVWNIVLTYTDTDVTIVSNKTHLSLTTEIWLILHHMCRVWHQRTSLHETYSFTQTQKPRNGLDVQPAAVLLTQAWMKHEQQNRKHTKMAYKENNNDVTETTMVSSGCVCLFVINTDTEWAATYSKKCS